MSKKDVKINQASRTTPSDNPSRQAPNNTDDASALGTNAGGKPVSGKPKKD